MSLVVKNIGLGRENTWGSAGTINKYPRVRSLGMNFDMGTKIVDDTANTAKGFSKAVNLAKTVEGDISFYVYPDDIGLWLASVLGIPSVGVEAGETVVFNHLFEQGNTKPFYTIVADKDVEVDRFLGVKGLSLKLNAANDIIEGVLTAQAKDKDTGSIYVPSVTEIDPFTFDQAAFGVGSDIAGAIAALASGTPMDEWELTYDLQSERRFQSGSKLASRIDAKIPRLSGSFKLFYDANSWENNLINETEKAFALQVTGGAIGNASNYKLLFKVPRIQAMSNERPYEAGNLIVETVNWEALYDTVSGYMLQAILTNLTASYS